jgi:hypothetical protein
MPGFDEGYKEVTTRFIEQWEMLAPAIVGMVTAPEIRFQDVELPEPPDETFGRFVMDEVQAPQATMRNAEFGQRFTHYGIIIVQLLIRKRDEGSAEMARKLAECARGIFIDPTFPGCYIFQNVRINNLAPEPQFIRRNVVAEYQFDETT